MDSLLIDRSLRTKLDLLRHKAPFFNRNYGGYTSDQKEFYEKNIGTCRGKIILDPMAGQGYYLTELVLDGAEVWLGDINPAPLFLASLRDPKLFEQHVAIRLFVEDKLRYFRRRTILPDVLSYSDEWLPLPIRLELLEYSKIFNLTRYGDPYQQWDFWYGDSVSPIDRFAALLPVLAARELVCFHESDNITWLKPGGIQYAHGIYEPIMHLLDCWCDYAKLYLDFKNDIVGTFHVGKMNVEHGEFGPAPTPEIVITSPPYANRLDYTRLWAPELEVISALFDTDIKAIKREQIGSTVTSKKEAQMDLSLLEERLSKKAVEALRLIRDDQNNKASKSYYYPFFVNYATSLEKSMKEIARKLSAGGQLIVFVRDTVRKDALFPTRILIEHVLAQQGFRLVGIEQKVIRHHLGLRRKRSSATGLHGLAQREWWLAFGK